MKLTVKKQLLLFLPCLLVLVILCVCLGALSAKAEVKSDSHSFAVYITEILASNGAYPDHNGNYHDFVELYNSADSSIDISGYHLTDNDKDLKYTFPEGTILPADSYLVVWCETDCDGAANFSISKSGGETVYLMNRKNVMIDSVVTIPTKRDLSMIPDGDTWTLSSYATPGFPNTQEGYDAYLASRVATGFPVVISELVANNKSYSSPDGTPYDYIELYNPTGEPVDISGCRISDDPEDMKYTFPEGTVLAAGEYRVFWCGGEEGLPFRISSDGSETVLLRSPGGDEIDSVTPPALVKDTAYALVDGSWAVTGCPTPGAANVNAVAPAESTEGAALGAVSSLPAASSVTVVLSEVMPSNETTWMVNGTFPDWIELWNSGSDPVSLSGWFLSDNPDKPDKYPCPDVTLQPGEYLLLLCDGTGIFDGTWYHTNFSLSHYGETLSLVNDSGELAALVSLPETAGDQSILCTGAEPECSDTPTPGYPNTDSGLASYQASLETPAGLCLSEAMTANDAYLQQPDDKYYDWVELYNNGSEPVSLSGWYLTDNLSYPTRFALPEVTLQPGEYYTAVLADGTLSLNAEDETLYLTNASGACKDSMRLRNLSYRGSYGRMAGENGYFYFEEATPGKENTGGKRDISPVPTLSVAPGIYNDITSLTVALEGEGTLYYTLDGSWPTVNSACYTAPLELTSTTVLRAICVQDGSLPSAVISGSYILNENHTFPVVSLSMDPGDFSTMYKFYYGDHEQHSNCSFYDLDGSSFSIDCGTCIFGSLSRETLAKKSLKLVFRAAYGEDTLNYDLYEGSGVTEFSSLVLRSGQDCTFAMIREELMTSLAHEASGSLQTVNTRYVILYINGEYWGIYNLKEAFSEEFFASHNEVSTASTKLVRMTDLTEKAPELWEIISTCHKLDMTQEENYQYLCDNIDIESLADWIIFESYCSNSDILNNVRYVMSTDLDGKWKHCFYDVDWSFRYSTATLPIRSDEVYAYLPKAALQNAEFRQYFLERLAYHLQNSLSTDSVNRRIDELTEAIAPEMERDWARWDLNLVNYTSNVQQLRDYVQNRPAEMVSEICDYLGVSSTARKEIFGGIV